MTQDEPSPYPGSWWDDNWPDMITTSGPPDKPHRTYLWIAIKSLDEQGHFETVDVPLGWHVSTQTTPMMRYKDGRLQLHVLILPDEP